MFARRAAPFFQFATPIELPPLSEPFVDRRVPCLTFARVTGETLNRKIVLEAFEAGPIAARFFRASSLTRRARSERDVVHGAQTLRARLAADLG